MALTGTNIATDASAIAKDENQVVWVAADMLRWVNDAQRAVCLVRSDAYTNQATVTLVAGTRQSITGRRLVRVLSNASDSGGTIVAGSKAPRTVDFQDLLNADRDWMTGNTGTSVREVAYDEREPTKFWVNPGSDGSSRFLNVLQSELPTDLTALTDPIVLSDIYAPAMVEWVLYRMFSYDSEVTPNIQRAQSHFTAFFNLLNVKMRSDFVTTPDVEDVREELRASGN